MPNPTYVQGPNTANCISGCGTTLSLPITQTTATGNLLGLVISTFDGTQTMSLPLTLTGANTNVLNLTCIPSTYSMSGTAICYVPPTSNTLALTSPLTVTFNKATGRQNIIFYEIAPPSSCTLGVDAANALFNQSGTNTVGPSFTLTGASSFSIQGILPNSVPSSISTGTNVELNADLSSALILSGYSGAASTWNGAAGGTPFAAAFGCSPNYYLNQSYNTLTGSGTFSGASLTATNAGWGGGNAWINGTTNIFSYSSQAGPTLAAVGRIADGITYNGTTSVSGGIVATWDGGTDLVYNQFPLYKVVSGNNKGVLPVTGATATIEYNEDLAATDTSSIDCFMFHGDSTVGGDFVTFNCYGNGTSRYICLEAPAPGVGNGCNGSPTDMAVFWNPPSQCPCKLVLHYATETGGVAGTHSGMVYDKNGKQLASFTQKTLTTFDPPGYINIGNVAGSTNVTAGKHSYWNNFQFSLDAVVPGQFCVGSSPTWTSTPDSVSLQTCFTNATGGDTINILAGTATWSAVQVLNQKGVNISGATTCSGTGTSSASCVDNTNIILSGGSTYFLGTNPPSCSSVVTYQGVTWNWQSGGGNTANGALLWSNPHCAWPLSGPQMRLTNSHIITSAPSSGSVFGAIEGMFGLIDHIFYERNSGNTGMFGLDGDRPNRGYPPWLAPPAWGTQNALYLETNTFIDHAGTNTEGPIDCYSGSRYVFRFNYVSGTHNGGCHGTDSDPTRGVMLEESYGNIQLNNNTSGINYTSSSPIRGGTAFIFGETYQVSGTGVSWAGVELQCLRCSANACGPGGDCSSYGLANGTFWYENSPTYSSTGAVTNTSNGPGWTANNSYTSGFSIIPTTGNGAFYTFTTFGACTSGPPPGPSTWNQTIGGSVADGTCTWINSKGAVATGTLALFCNPVNSDLLVALGGSCPAGDTATGGFDGSAANGYPVRDQVGRVHTTAQGQALAPVYIWSMTPAAAGEAFVFPATTNIQECRDYYQQFSGTFNGTCQAGNGIGVGTFANIPSTCTPGVGYFATDQGTWNQSGNGFGNGILYQCSSGGAWVPYYTPLQYPHPLINTSNQVATPNFNPIGGTYPTAQSITLTSATGGATICYTLDGSTPTTNGAGSCVNGITYTGSFVISNIVTTIRAIGTESGLTDSSLTSATYILNIPTFSFNSSTSMTLNINSPWKITRY